MTDALSQMRTSFIKIQNAEARGNKFLKNEGDTDLFRGLQRQDDARRQIKKDLVANWDRQGFINISQINKSLTNQCGTMLR